MPLFVKKIGIVAKPCPLPGCIPSLDKAAVGMFVKRIKNKEKLVFSV